MALKSWSIKEFTGAASGSPVTQTLLDSTTNTIILLSLLIANNSGEVANITVQRLSSTDVVKMEWQLAIPSDNSPVAIDSMMVFEGGDKLSVTSDAEFVSVDASGDES